MKKFLQFMTLATLVVWGVLFLYFYTSGRIEKYLDPSFRIYALISGIGFLLLAGFNFINRNRETGVCTHDHVHGEACDHDHHHIHDSAHDHGHDRSHEEADRENAQGHGHKHEDGHACCGHGHDHGHEHKASHDHEHGLAHHHEHEETSSGIAFSLLVLLVPMLVATGYSHDRFSAEYLTKWGKIERQMMQMRISDARAKEAPGGSQASVTNPYTREGIEGAGGETGAAPYPGQADTPPEPKSDTAGEAWGAFTLDDLKKMVPQNDVGEFLLDVPQIFYTAGDRELMEVMEGIPVETTAQLMEETLNNPDNTRLKAFRLFIECCAADARPLSIPVDFGQAPPDYTEMGWYRLYGKLHYAHENDEIIPMIKIERIEATSEPSDGLLF